MPLPYKGLTSYMQSCRLFHRPTNYNSAAPWTTSLFTHVVSHAVQRSESLVSRGTSGRRCPQCHDVVTVQRPCVVRPVLHTSTMRNDETSDAFGDRTTTRVATDIHFWKLPPHRNVVTGERRDSCPKLMSCLQACAVRTREVKWPHCINKPPHVM